MTQLIYAYSQEKNARLIRERSISFEEVIAAIDNGQLLDIIQHPNVKKYPNQKIYVVYLNDYVYLVPFIKKDKQTLFLKTIIPSRKAKKQYLTSEKADEN